MTQLIQKPDRDVVKKWGELAYVDEVERKRILELPFGEFKPACEYLKKRIAEMKKKNRKGY